MSQNDLLSCVFSFICNQVFAFTKIEPNTCNFCSTGQGSTSTIFSSPFSTGKQKESRARDVQRKMTYDVILIFWLRRGAPKKGAQPFRASSEESAKGSKVPLISSYFLLFPCSQLPWAPLVPSKKIRKLINYFPKNIIFHKFVPVSRLHPLP